ncbi:hypothetical protein Tco_1494100 [Tanacetum coccineum]
MIEEDVFMNSLICNVGEDCEKLLISSLRGKSPFPDIDDFIEYIASNGDLTDYRSPLRTLPENILSDFNIRIKENTTEDSLDENVVMSSDEEDWWREAILVTGNLESMPRKIDLSKEENETWDEDNDCSIDADNTDKEIE